MRRSHSHMYYACPGIRCSCVESPSEHPHREVGAGPNICIQGGDKQMDSWCFTTAERAELAFTQGQEAVHHALHLPKVPCVTLNQIRGKKSAMHTLSAVLLSTASWSRLVLSGPLIQFNSLRISSEPSSSRGTDPYLLFLVGWGRKRVSHKKRKVKGWRHQTKSLVTKAPTNRAWYL